MSETNTLPRNSISGVRLPELGAMSPPSLPKPVDRPVALAILVEAMMLVGSVNPNAAEHYRAAFKVAIAAAPSLLDAQQTTRSLKAYLDQLDRHAAMRADNVSTDVKTDARG